MSQVPNKSLLKKALMVAAVTSQADAHLTLNKVHSKTESTIAMTDKVRIFFVFLDSRHGEFLWCIYSYAVSVHRIDAITNVGTIQM